MNKVYFQDFVLIVIPALICSVADAQVLKCKDQSGRVTYTQGTTCPVGQMTGSVNLSGGNVSTRTQEELYREEAKLEAAQLENPPIECRFSRGTASYQSKAYSAALSAAATQSTEVKPCHPL
ncbi:MAG: DUF4124 domain-containing protein [Comamonadaceae bacterium]|nr:DUF4124 domain-containing protein [Comamonadaceae bacterium]